MIGGERILNNNTYWRRLIESMEPEKLKQYTKTDYGKALEKELNDLEAKGLISGFQKKLILSIKPKNILDFTKIRIHGCA
ncbi:hypothetical protein CLFO_15470 [Clostridium formicaceticum]|uniref:Uncharacterized protein n=1 Tax=Clostridium formicaceticum TaxID=1497 RepID=A0AAC9RK83_9CLOT|nr:hypothetical protein BJL90_13105 [Clostridium formicaceticum]ARE87159.1 hypothetical protein CLFO_15470 [Clostridium formicaceticum]